MSIVKINENVYFESTEFASVQEEILNRYTSPSPSDHTMEVEFHGSVITLKNGRKIFVRGMMPDKIIEKIEDSK